MDRRAFIGRVAGGVLAMPLATRAQTPSMPVIGFLGSASAAQFAPYVAGFRRGLNETGYVEGKNVAIEFRWAEGHYDRLPALAADLVRRQVAVIFTTGAGGGARAAKAATSTIPIVFTVSRDPVELGYVASLGHPGGNLTGINFFAGELVEKRLSCCMRWCPKPLSLPLS